MNTSTAASARCDDLSGQRAVITGASSGIGRAIAIELARCGAKTHLHARGNRAGLEVTRQQIQELTGHRPTYSIADLAEGQQLIALGDEAFGQLSTVDIWINNAGADVLTGELASATFAQKLARLWQVDVLGTINLSRLVGQRMKQQGRGVILNMGWDQAMIGQAGDSGELFAASKSAIMGFSLSLAKSLAPDVRVNCIAPGWIRTAWGESASAEWSERARRESLRGRWGTPEDVAVVTRFLASPNADFVNGQIVQVNGGLQTADSHFLSRQ